MICARRIGRGEVKRVGGVRVYVYGTLFMHVVPKGKNKKSNVGGSAPFINMEPPDV